MVHHTPYIIYTVIWSLYAYIPGILTSLLYIIHMTHISPYRGFRMAQRWVIGITPIYRLGNIGNIPEILVKNIQPANI